MRLDNIPHLKFPGTYRLYLLYHKKAVHFASGDPLLYGCCKVRRIVMGFWRGTSWLGMGNVNQKRLPGLGLTGHANLAT